MSGLIPFRSQTLELSLSNAILAFAVLAVTSSSVCTVLERVSDSQIGEFINNLKVLSIHSDGWYAFHVLAGVLAQSFSADCKVIGQSLNVEKK